MVKFSVKHNIQIIKYSRFHPPNTSTQHILSHILRLHDIVVTHTFDKIQHSNLEFRVNKF